MVLSLPTTDPTPPPTTGSTGTQELAMSLRSDKQAHQRLGMRDSPELYHYSSHHPADIRVRRHPNCLSMILPARSLALTAAIATWTTSAQEYGRSPPALTVDLAAAQVTRTAGTPLDTIELVGEGTKEKGEEPTVDWGRTRG